MKWNEMFYLFVKFTEISHLFQVIPISYYKKHINYLIFIQCCDKKLKK